MGFASEIVTPSQSFSREISRLLEAVAIFTFSGIQHVHTARDDVRGEESDSAVKPLRTSLIPREGKDPAEDPRAGPKLIGQPPMKKSPFFKGGCLSVS